MNSPTGPNSNTARGPTGITGATAAEVGNISRYLTTLGRNPDEVTVTEAQKIAEENAGPAYIQDKWFYRGALLSLLSIVLFTIIGVCWIVIDNKTAPDGLIAIGSAAVGAFAGIFTTSSQKM
jgi:hypothetical protein